MTSRASIAWIVGSLVTLALASSVAYGVAVHILAAKVAEALGPRSETAAIHLGLAGVIVDGRRIPAPEAWPASDELRAQRITISPSLQSLVSGDELRIRSIHVVAPYLSALRSGDGTLVALPGLLGDTGGRSDTPAEPVKVGLRKIRVEAGVLELFDATVARPALKIRLEQIEATLHDLEIPGLRGRSGFELDGVVKGEAHDGHAHVEGWAELGTRDSSLSVELRDVDLVPLQPYLVRPGEAGVRRGRIDLDMRSVVDHALLDAHGTITISDLELSSGRGLANTFLGVSHDLVLAGMKDRGGKLTLDFTLSGDINAPDLSLNEALGTKLAVSLAETLGVSLGGLVKGVGSLGQSGGEALGQAIKGVGGALSDLIKGDPKR